MRLNTNILNNFIDVENLFLFEELSAEENNQVLECVQDRILDVKQKPGQSQWDKYWGELNANNAESPNFFKKKTLLNFSTYRLNGRYVKSQEENLGVRVQQEILKKVLEENPQIKNVIEFGAGTGHNLQYIKDLNKDISVLGTDFSYEAIDLMRKRGISSQYFDMIECSEIPYQKNTMFLTSGSMEQLGPNWIKFWEFVNNFRPLVLVNIEPILEFYTDSAFDSVAARYHKLKGYLSDFYSKAILPRNKSVSYRNNFGTIFDEGFNTVITKF